MVSYSPSGARKPVASARPRRCATAPKPASRRPAGTTSGVGLVVLVADIADDLLDHVLDRHHARGAAVFVDDQRGLQPVGPNLRHHVVAVQRRGTLATGNARPASRVSGRVAVWHLENLFDVHDADRLVEVALHDREAGVAGPIALTTRSATVSSACNASILVRGVISSRRCGNRTAMNGPPARR